MRLFGRLLVAAALVAAVAPTARAQGLKNFMNRWFWSVEAGATIYRTNFSAPAADASGSTYTAAPTFGINWFITAHRVALQIGFEETLFTQVAESQVADASSATGTRIIRSDELRRYSATLIALPLATRLQPFVGIGIAIHQSAGIRPRGASALPLAELKAALDNAEQFSTTAAATFLAGVNYFVDKRWVVYGQYRVAAGSENFLLDQSIHTFSGGLRFNFGSARAGTRSRL